MAPNLALEGLVALIWPAFPRGTEQVRQMLSRMEGGSCLDPKVIIPTYPDPDNQTGSSSCVLDTDPPRKP